MKWDIIHARFVAASSIIPKAAIKAGFWEIVSENAPFSWGGNSHALVSAKRFAEHCENAYAGRPALPAILRRLRELDELAVYVDLEA